MPTNTDLWQRIQAFEPDDPADEYPFSARLARGNHWSLEEALGAIEEYKRFIYLICVSPLPLTPSEAVDQVWHLHLLYTRSYWTDLCEGVLGRAMHHEPTKGGREQRLKFEEQYAQTLSLYADEFGSEPPVAFWPLAPFVSMPSQHWVDRRDHWILPKRACRWLLAGGTVALMVLLASCESLWADQKTGTAELGFVNRMFVLTIPFGLLWFAALARRSSKVEVSTAGADCDGGGCSGGCGGCGA
jgi:hypothetical protein